MSIDWEMYEACTMCPAGAGKPCLQLTGYNAAHGVHDVEEATEPHSTRKLRAAAKEVGCK